MSTRAKTSSLHSRDVFDGMKTHEIPQIKVHGFGF
ncbi:uncharacterized protein G2W53_038190 [Senna tora]|uniref:Uncharacterized protein n=1 Tax=Senna tora TaxID=362788 RepID=A0A834W6J5_9FABA|nr:uncharacterized protein G2W53_038190 [Senna tora]